MLDVPDWMTHEECASEIATLVVSSRPSRLLEGFTTSLLEARKDFKMGIEAAGAVKFGASNVLRANDHYPALITILGGEGYCTATAPDAWDGVRALCARCDKR